LDENDVCSCGFRFSWSLIPVDAERIAGGDMQNHLCYANNLRPSVRREADPMFNTLTDFCDRCDALLNADEKDADMRFGQHLCNACAAEYTAANPKLPDAS